jgi:membrane associated rhomboid family serine protease
MVRFTFFPYFGSYTFIFFYLILITFVFCYSLSWERTQEELNNGDDEFLRVSQNALFELGENYPYYIVFKFHYYRILTSMFLFRNFYQYILTALGILTFGSYIEQ